MTFGLALIVKDEVERVKSLVDNYGSYFDKVYITVTGKFETWEDPKIEWSSFKWCDDFSKARNFNFSQVKTDYVMWLDADDEIQQAEKLPELFDFAVGNQLDYVYLAYNYAQNDHGECIAWQWRERLVRTGFPIKWEGIVHETIVPQGGMPMAEKYNDIVIFHSKSADEVTTSMERNHKLLLKGYKKTKDPRYSHYLGLSYFGMGLLANKEGNKTLATELYSTAIEYFLEHVRTSGWDEETYRSWIKIAEAEWMLDRHDKAEAAAHQAMKVLPSYPDAYLFIGQLYFEQSDYKKALEWLNVGYAKKLPNTLSIIDPTGYNYRSMMIAALCYLNLGRIKEAYALYKEIKRRSPEFEQLETFGPLFEEVQADQEAIDKVKWLTHYLIQYKAKPEKLFESLPERLMARPALMPERAKVFKPKTWEDNSIVFYCGSSAEAWGPDTLSKGMGGSEEAIVYLSRELAKQGYQVTVYCDREDSLQDFGGDYSDEPQEHPVTYLPFTLFNPNDKFNILIAWRASNFFTSMNIDAKFKGVDLHDTPIGHAEISPRAIEVTDKFFFKSEFQWKMSDVPKEKAAIISNGIVPSQFDVEVKRNPHKIIFGSSPDRGLDTLMELLPEVRKVVPDIEVVWAYGWDSYDAMHRGKPEQGKWKLQMIRKMHDMGVKALGRLSHEELAKEFKSSGVWAYPTSFPEINCITAIKAQAAGCDVVTSGYAALQETVIAKKEEDIEDINLKPEKLAEFTARLLESLQKPLEESKRAEIAKQTVERFKWSEISSQWKQVLDGKAQ